MPPLGVTITPPDGVAQPVVTENIGSTTTVNNDAHVRVWMAQIPADGTYNITTDGQVNGFIDPRLAFGHSSSYGFMVWVFVAMFVVGLVGSIVSAKWLGRARRKAAAGGRCARVARRQCRTLPSAPPLRDAGQPAQRRVRTQRRGRPARAAQNTSGAAGFRRVDRSGVRGREAPDPRRALIFASRERAQNAGRTACRCTDAHARGQSSVAPGHPLLVVDDLVADGGAVAVAGVHDGVAGQRAEPL